MLLLEKRYYVNLRNDSIIECIPNNYNQTKKTQKWLSDNINEPIALLTKKQLAEKRFYRTNKKGAIIKSC